MPGVQLAAKNVYGLSSRDEHGSFGRLRKFPESLNQLSSLILPRRIQQVEQKIDGLVAKLVNPPPVARPAESSAGPVTVTAWESAPTGGIPSATWQGTSKQRPVGPGSWLLFPTSFEQSSEPPEKAPEKTRAQTAQQSQPVNEDTEADRQYIEEIRTIHRFGDAEDVHMAPEGLFQPSKTREPPIEHSLIQELLATNEADILLDTYRQMSASFPFVIVPPAVKARELYQKKPMLLLATIIAASSQQHQRQMSLDTIFRKELAERTIITPRRTLGLVQSVLVYLSWSVERSGANCAKLTAIGTTSSSAIKHSKYSSYTILS
jgi:hypothetical protein